MSCMQNRQMGMVRLHASWADRLSRSLQVFETPKRGPGFTDAPTNRLRKQRSSPYKVPPAYQPSNRVRRSTNLSEQEQVDIPTTPEDEARGGASLFCTRVSA